MCFSRELQASVSSPGSAGARPGRRRRRGRRGLEKVFFFSLLFFCANSRLSGERGSDRANGTKKEKQAVFFQQQRQQQDAPRTSLMPIAAAGAFTRRERKARSDKGSRTRERERTRRKRGNGLLSLSKTLLFFVCVPHPLHFFFFFRFLSRRPKTKTLAHDEGQDAPGRLALEEPVFSIDFHPSGLLATGGGDKDVKVNRERFF